MITRAVINHYKSVAEADLSFGSMNVFVGSNGGGKSNIVDALYFVHDALTEDLDTAITRRHGITSIRQWSKYRPFHISIELHVEHNLGRGVYKLVIGSTRGSYKVVEESGEWFGRNPIHFSANREDNTTARWTRFFRTEDGNVALHSEHPVPENAFQPVTMSSSELFASTLTGPVYSLVMMLISPLTDAISSFITYSIYPNTLREPRVVSRQEQLSADGSNLASILKQMSKEPELKEELISSLQVILPELTDIQVRSAGGYYVPVIKIGRDSEDGHFFNMSQISDGTLRVLGLLTAFYQPNAPAIIAVEEPEQMINPGLLPVIVDAANDFATRRNMNHQVFITTHSPSLVDLVDPSSIIWTRFSDGITTCGPVVKRQLDLVKENLFTAGEIMLSEGFLDQ